MFRVRMGRERMQIQDVGLAKRNTPKDMGTLEEGARIDGTETVEALSREGLQEDPQPIKEEARQKMRSEGKKEKADNKGRDELPMAVADGPEIIPRERCATCVHGVFLFRSYQFESYECTKQPYRRAKRIRSRKGKWRVRKEWVAVRCKYKER